MKLNLKTIFSGAVLAAFAAPSAVVAEEECQTIAEIACGLDDFSTLCAAVVAAGLDGALAGEGPLTVFAPTNEAFGNLPEGTVEALLDDIPTLTTILLTHVVSGAFFADDVVTPEVCAGGGDVGLIETLSGEDVRTICCHSCTPAEKIFIKGAGNPRTGAGNAVANQDIWPQLVATDVEACNGVIHVLNNVILP